MNQHSPVVLGLNGPAHSGKTWIARYLLKLIPDAIIISIPEVIYADMQLEGLEPKGMLYQDFKLTPDARAKTIKFSAEARGSDIHYFDRRITDSDAWHSSRVVIIDNIGFASEMSWFDNRSRAAILLRLDSPYQEIEPMKSRARRLKAAWENDSRAPVEHHSMLTAYDSQQMVLLLDWLQRPLLREEAGPYYGIKSLWTQYIAGSESVGSTSYSRPRNAGSLGGLGKAADEQSIDRRVGNDLQTS
jgi:hypothetical protein